MNSLDIAIVIICLIFAVSGLSKGLIRAAFSLAALCLGLYGAFSFHDEISKELSAYLKNEQINTLISFAALFFAIYIPLFLVGTGIRKVVKSIKLGWLDRILGIVFGGLKGMAVCCVGVLILVSFLPPKTQIITQSKLAPQLIAISKKVMLMAQGYLEHSFDMKKFDDLEQMLQNQDTGNGKKFKHISIPRPAAKTKA